MRQRGYGGGSGSGAAGITVASTTITSGTANRVLYDNGTVVSESANLTFDGTAFYVGTGVMQLKVDSATGRITATNYNAYLDLITSTLSAGPGIAVSLIGGTQTTTPGIVLTNAGNGGIAGQTVQIIQGSYINGGGGIAQRITAAASRTDALLHLETSANGSLGNVSGGCIADLIAAVSTTHTDGTFDTLWTVTTVANALIANGDKLDFDVTFTTVSSATASRDFKVAFAGITILDSTALVFGAGVGTVRIYGYLTRVTSTTALSTVTYDPSGSATILGQKFNKLTLPAVLTGLTLTGTNSLVVSAAASGTGAASGDITLQHGVVRIEGFGS